MSEYPKNVLAVGHSLFNLRFEVIQVVGLHLLLVGESKSAEDPAAVVQLVPKRLWPQWNQMLVERTGSLLLPYEARVRIQVEDGANWVVIQIPWARMAFELTEELRRDLLQLTGGRSR